MKKLKEFLIALIVAILSYGSFLIYPTIGIDTEAAVLNYHGLVMSWRTISREGLSIIKDIFFPTYNQFQNNILAILALAILVFLITLLTRLNIFIIAVAFIAMPFTYSQMYFQMQSFEVILGAIITLISFYLLMKKSYHFIYLTIFTVGFAISIYQSIFDYAIACFAIFLLMKSEIKIKDIVIGIINLLGSLVVYWILNNVINRIPQSSYLTFDIFNLYSMRAIVYILLVIILCIILYMSNKLDLFHSLSLCAFLSSPAVTLVFTGSWKFRAMFPCAPFVLSITLAYLIYKYKNIFIKVLCGLVMSLSILFIAYFERREYIRYTNDVTIAKEIVSQIPSDEYRVQFVGKYTAGQTVSNAFTEPAGISFFAWDPVPYQSRSDNMLKLVGGKFQESSLEENEKAAIQYQDVTLFTETHKVFIDQQNKVVVVKFS